MENNLLSMAFACSNDRDQAEFINEIARELFVRCGGRNVKGTINGYEAQCCNISRYLNKDGVQLVKDLHAFIELREKEMS